MMRQEADDARRRLDRVAEDRAAGRRHDENEAWAAAWARDLAQARAARAAALAARGGDAA